MAADDYVRNCNASRIYYINRMVIQLNWNMYVPGYPNISAFNIYRADNQEGTFIQIGTTALVSYLDTSAKLDLLSDYVYKITFVYDPGTGDEESEIDNAIPIKVLMDKAVGFGGINEYLLNEEIRRINLFIGSHIGEDVIIFLRKYVGPECTCYNKYSDRVKDPNCDICYGTGIVGGYEQFRTRMFFTSGQEKIIEASRGIHIDYKISAIIGPYPVLHSQDYVFRQDGIIYGIVDSTPERFENKIKEQTVKLNEMRPDNPIYKFASVILGS